MAKLAIYGSHHPGFITGQWQDEKEVDALMPQTPPGDDRFPNTFFCRALYDYQTDDQSSLSFRRDDIIEVLNQLESGWWDGLLRDERGWFPSNYVVPISDEEAEAALAASESFSQNHESPVFPDAMQGRVVSGQDRQWLEAEMNHASSQNGLLELAHATMEAPSQSSDFWMPQVTLDGQIYYVNTQTGQHSRDLPHEADDEPSDSDLAGFASQSSSRSGTSVGLMLSARNSELSDSSQESMNPALLKRGGTPDPWVKKLADDGMSYYYWNKLTGQIDWTRPDADPPSVYDTTIGRDQAVLPPNKLPASYSITRDSPLPPPRLRSESSASQIQRHDNADARRISVYSDDSGIHPLDLEHSSSSAQLAPINGNLRRDKPYRPRLQQTPMEGIAAELTSAERLAQSLQISLAPSPPELIADLSDTARKAIMAVVENLQSTGFSRRPEEDSTMDSLIQAVVLSVRNLLYVSALPPHIPANVLPRVAKDRKVNNPSQTLKPAQRKVTATLSKLVLSARAMQYDSRASEINTPNRIEGDAEELERAFVAFVLAAERSRKQEAIEGEEIGPKRLFGAFSTANVGLGLVGAGSAGRWKGFGWVALDDDSDPPRRVLGTELLSELASNLQSVEEQLSVLSQTLEKLTESADHLYTDGQKAVTYLSAFLSLLSSVHVARHVDIDGISQGTEQSPTNELYAQTVDKARLLVRTLEVAVQSLYDDCSTLLLAIQSFKPSEVDNQSQDREYLDSLTTALKANLKVVQQTLEELLSVGHEQADMAQGDYTGSIEWRMSRLSLIDNQFGGTLRPTSGSTHQLYHLDGEDVIDIEHAFRPPESKTHDSMGIIPPASPALGPALDPAQSGSGDETAHPQHISFSDRAITAQVQSDALSDINRESNASPLFDDEVVPPTSRPTPRRVDKVRDILGDEAPQHYIDTVNAELKPWYLRPNYSPTDILIDHPEGTVRGGTVPALVERLTAHEHGDPTFIKTFLMTYKSFTTLDELFDLLVQRFWIKPPSQLTPTELEEWTRLKQHVIQMRVLNTFKSMVGDYDILEKEDMYILDRMREFISNEEVIRFAAAKQLMISIERAQRGGTDAIKMTATLQTPPPPIMPKSSKKLKLLDIDPLELARQLTIVESQLYQKIRPIECLLRAREQKSEHNDNIAAVIQTSNRIADWVADSILSRDDSRRRAAAVKQFISIADRCRALHNYSTMVAITSGLNTPPIRRLKRTWDQVNAKLMAQLGACEMTIDSNKNFNNYRLTLASVSPPCVPFIGVFLTTLQFIQDGSDDNISPNIVNFRKRQKASEVIQDIKRWQSQPFSFHPVPTILAFIEESLNQFSDAVDIRDRFWNLSLEREPREREDEKMARLLQESGFL